MLDIFDLISRLMDPSTAIYPESTVACNLAVMDIGEYVKLSIYIHNYQYNQCGVMERK